MGIRRHLGGSVYFLLDISPSMQGDGLAQAKRGLQDLVGQVISDGFGIGLITFDSKTRFLCSPTRDPASLRERVNDLRITGQGTVMAPAIGMAAAKLSGEAGAKFIILATDGEAHDPKAAYRAASRAKADGVEIITVGTEGADREFLERIASRAGWAVSVETNRLEHGIRQTAGLLRSPDD